MKRNALLLLAAVLFAFYAYGFVQWLASGHSFADVWRLATSDWFLAVTLLDLSLFGLACIIWVVRDMKRRNLNGGKIFLMVLACLVSGFVPFLVYLAFRPPGTASV